MKPNEIELQFRFRDLDDIHKNPFFVAAVQSMQQDFYDHAYIPTLCHSLELAARGISTTPSNQDEIEELESRISDLEDESRGLEDEKDDLIYEIEKAIELLEKDSSVEGIQEVIKKLKGAI